MTRINSNIRLGLFVISGVILFVTGIYLIGNNQNLFKKSLHLSAIFNNVGGLQPGNNVRFNGIDVGTIENIDIMNDSMLVVNMKIDWKVRPFIRKDAVASIGSDGLVGNMLVNISPGAQKESIVEDGDRLESYSRFDTEEMISTLGSTNETIALIAENILSITDKMNKGNGVLSLLLQDSSFSTNLEKTMIQLRTSSQNLTVTSQTLKQIIDHINHGEGSLGQLLKDSSLYNKMVHSMETLDTVIEGFTGLSDDILPIIDELQISSRQISAFTSDMNEIVEKINTGDGTVTALLQDSSLSSDLKQTLENLNQGSARFNENMEALKSNFLFRKYFRKQERAARKAAKKSDP